MALKAGTSYKYLQKLSGHFGVPSMELAARLKAQYPKLTFEGFLPSADTRATRSRRVVSATAKRKAKS